MSSMIAYMVRRKSRGGAKTTGGWRKKRQHHAGRIRTRTFMSMSDPLNI